MKPLFSVIIPTYNRNDFIRISVDSVLRQTYCDFELIVVDDGSTDLTYKTVSEYSDRRVNYIRTQHFGVSAARNTGIDLSKGEYLCFLDSDDKWGSKKLEIASNYIAGFADTMIFHTDEIWYKNGKMLNQKKKHKKPDGYVYPNCLPLCCIGMSTSVVRKSVFDEIGKFDTKMPACEDYDLWLRACSIHEVKLIPRPLTIKDGGREDQLSNQPGLDKYRIYALEKILESGALNDNQYFITAKEIVRKCEIYAKGALKRNKLKEADNYLNLIKEYEKNPS